VARLLRLLSEWQAARCLTLRGGAVTRVLAGAAGRTPFDLFAVVRTLGSLLERQAVQRLTLGWVGAAARRLMLGTRLK